MSKAARRALGIGVALITGLSYAGCAASGTNSAPKPDRTQPSEAGSPSEAAGGDGDSGAAPTATAGKGGQEIYTDSSAGSGGTPDDSCAAEVSKAETVPLDMFIMMDTSLSMNDVTANGVVKWSAVKGALESFVQDDFSRGLGVGIQYFPQNKPNIPSTCTNDAQCGAASPCLLKICWGYDELVQCVSNLDCNSGPFGPVPDCEPYARCASGPYVCKGVGQDCVSGGATPVNYGMCSLVTDPLDLSQNNLGYCVNTAKCDAASYEAPAEAIAPLPDAAAKLIASIEAQTPHGNTPTAPALTGAIAQASAWAKTHPNHQVIALMVTDGMPSQCSPNSISEITQIASDGLAAAPSVKTFVVGVFGATDIGAGAGSNLDKIAKAGGTNKAFIVYTSDDVSMQFSRALEAIRGTRLACEYEVPEAKAGQNEDYSRLNLNFKTRKGSTTVYYVGSLSDCDPISGGWYYNTDPETTAPTRIEVCPTTCTAFSTASDASVEIAVGCQTVVK